MSKRKASDGRKTIHQLTMFQHAQLSRSPSRGMLIGSPKSPLNSSVSSCARALCAITGMGLDNSKTYVMVWMGLNLTFECLFNIKSFLGAGFKVWKVAV